MSIQLSFLGVNIIVGNFLTPVGNFLTSVGNFLTSVGNLKLMIWNLKTNSTHQILLVLNAEFIFKKRKPFRGLSVFTSNQNILKLPLQKLRLLIEFKI